MNKELFFILPEPSGRRVLATCQDQGWTLPRYPRQVPTNAGFSNPAPFNAWFRQEYGPEVFRRYAVDAEHAAVAAYVLQAHRDPVDLRAGASWVAPKTLDGFCAARPTLRAALHAALDAATPSRTMPWAREGGCDEAIAWLLQALARHGLAPAGPIEQVKNAYVSTVLRCPTRAGFVYLKWLPGVFVRELEVTQALARRGIARLPHWLAADAERNMILMPDMGGRDLDAGAGLEVWKQVMRELARFQLASLPLVSPGPPSPFYDWRVPALMDALPTLAREAQALLRGSPYQLAGTEVARLEARLPQWRQLCAQIGASGLPDALDHGDLRPGNVRLVGDEVIFYDWAWSSVAHPFASAAMFLHVVRHDIETPGALEALRDAYLEAWTAYGSGEHLRATFGLVDEAKMVYAAIADAQWVRDVQEALGWQPPRPGSADAWTLDRRQYYLARVVRRLC
jgi:hypothetical protein